MKMVGMMDKGYCSKTKWEGKGIIITVVYLKFKVINNIMVIVGPLRKFLQDNILVHHSYKKNESSKVKNSRYAWESSWTRPPVMPNR